MKSARSSLRFVIPEIGAIYMCSTESESAHFNIYRPTVGQDPIAIIPKIATWNTQTSY